MVHPFVGYMSHRPQFILQPEEVNAILEVPLSLLQDSTIRKQKDNPLHNGLMLKNTPYFDIHDYTVWGATAMMLNEFLSVV